MKTVIQKTRSDKRQKRTFDVQTITNLILVSFVLIKNDYPMANILMWVGIALTVFGWLMLAWQASKRLAVKDELEKFPQKKHVMQLHRNYCWLTISVGIILLFIAIIL